MASFSQERSIGAVKACGPGWLHRITGVLIFFFLFAHVLDTALVRVSPEDYNTSSRPTRTRSSGCWRSVWSRAVLFHAFNGIRIVLIDFWSKGPRYQRQLTYGVVGSGVRALRAVRDPAPVDRVR